MVQFLLIIILSRNLSWNVLRNLSWNFEYSSISNIWIFEYFWASFLEVLRWCFIDVVKRCDCSGQLRLFIRIVRAAPRYISCSLQRAVIIAIQIFEYSNICVFVSTFTTVKLFEIFVKISTLVPRGEIGINVFVCLTKLTWVFVKIFSICCNVDTSSAVKGALLHVHWKPMKSLMKFLYSFCD